MPKPQPAPVVRNADALPNRGPRLDPKTRRAVATWTAPPGIANKVIKSHVWMGTFWFKAVGNHEHHLRGLESLVFPAPRSHHGVLESLDFPVPRGQLG